MSVHNEAQKAQLARLEVEYAEATGGEALITNEETSTTKYTFADGGEATNTDEAIKSASALVRFVKNQKGQQ
jgi:hypothetical protein